MSLDAIAHKSQEIFQRYRFMVQNTVTQPEQKEVGKASKEEGRKHSLLHGMFASIKLPVTNQPSKEKLFVAQVN